MKLIGVSAGKPTSRPHARESPPEARGTGAPEESGCFSCVTPRACPARRARPEPCKAQPTADPWPEPRLPVGNGPIHFAVNRPILLGAVYSSTKASTLSRFARRTHHPMPSSIGGFVSATTRLVHALARLVLGAIQASYRFPASVGTPQHTRNNQMGMSYKNAASGNNTMAWTEGPSCCQSSLDSISTSVAPPRTRVRRISLDPSTVRCHVRAGSALGKPLRALSSSSSNGLMVRLSPRTA